MLLVLSLTACRTTLKVEDTGEACEPRVWYLDADGDGHGALGEPAAMTVEACEQPDGWQASFDDCDDLDASSFPGGIELCDGADNDCDGSVDEDPVDALTWFQDLDGDGYGGEITDTACEQPSGWVEGGGDCNDVSAEVRPGAEELCNGIDDDCDGLVDASDDDLVDGFVRYVDVDGDGYGTDEVLVCSAGEGEVGEAGDCDDADPMVHPGAAERCNGIDDDCDGLVDLEDGELVDAVVFYADEDGDGFGGDERLGCEAAEGEVDRGGDCDDEAAAVNPDADEVCNGLDDDCDGAVDGQDDSVDDATTWYRDGDGDGWGNASEVRSSCASYSGWVADASDCDDSDEGVHPEADETCNGVDDDCDGVVDPDSAGTTWYIDHDGDGFGSDDYTTVACDQASGWLADAGDCDDLDAETYPGAPEACDGHDDDCDGELDEGCDTGADTGTTDTGAVDSGLDDTGVVDTGVPGGADTATADDWVDDGAVCASLWGSDQGSVPAWEGDCDEDAGFESYGDRCYYPVSSSTNWPNARATCAAAGGYLATATDASENSFLNGLHSRPHLGGCDGDVEGTWTWITGETWDYEAWGGSEPNDFTTGEDCLELYSTGTWNDIWCDSNPYTAGFVCEFGPATAPGDTGG